MKKTALVCAWSMMSVLATGLTVNAEELKIGAGAAPVENILKPVREAFEKASGINLNILAAGPKNAMSDLIRGNVEAAAAGLTFNDWLTLMKKEGQEVKSPETLKVTVIGKDRIVVITNKDNKVAALSKEQLQGIFSGKVENWKEVGGNDLPVLVVWGSLIQGTNSMFASNIMDGKPVTKEVVEVTTAADIKQNVQANPGAVGIGPAAVIDGSINAPKVPEVSRDITLVTKGTPSTKVQKLIDFITGAGRRYVKE